MDESEHVCPLCCEDLDLSDREFYPCKCGYQVCMWCWHRIRETESGLCPACRTPYGEDPHQFSAVDVDKAIKANKEKEAAAKRDRQRSGQNNPQQPGVPVHEHHIGEILSEASMEVPKDRTLLANMRVIRRNLVYAVGLPPTVGSEDNLRRADYFGQYGKIAKIVLNRTQATSGDPRRATCSAYVTFVHKEDTLACILAMDGFHMDGRNVRASYGTSKYCSAFIKNVRCNNPDCTYLHEMGAAEDTFTKQEIQAGYVTSGRDVLARQQQIVAEQLKQAGSGPAPRKRIGGGGPSGTGKASSHPIFPAPEFDEPTKPSPTLVPPPTGIARASTAGTGNTTVGLGPRPATRNASVGSKSPLGGPVPVATGSIAAVAAANLPPQRKPVSAASVVAGVHTVTPRVEPEPHTTLTPLTPLKRTSKTSRSTSSSADTMEKLAPARSVAAVKKKNGISASALPPQPAPPVAPPQPAPSLNTAPPPTAPVNGAKLGPSSIGGDPIGPPVAVRNITPVSSVASLGGDPVGPDLVAGGGGHSSLLGGAVYTGELHPKSNAAIRRGSDKWNETKQENTNLVPPPGNTNLWGGGSANDQNLPLGPSINGGGGLIGSSRAPGPGTIGNSSSALASLLGISLPTGSGSLQQSNWDVAPGPSSLSPSPLSSLNSGSVPVQGNVIGGGPVGAANGPGAGGSSLIGGIPIGGGSASSSFDNGAPGTIGGNNNNPNTKSDIALLQSLLPGVHITTGNETAGYGSIGGWNGRSGPSSLNGDAIVGNSNSWGSAPSEHGPAPVGTIGGGAVQQNQRGPGIW
uniref:CCR4-NOT transcription complex subunit 4 n=1 Tax=Entomoneis paludosa TaxID=265537 RepID=A0A7S2Y5J5_9STRA|mmetsp:Transcript_17250/g.35736  ORF Transcript_17250/g.35736 Transcript_17250/m.35736 type:complete len:801 (+) Transcript_17250:101-2503(+)